MRTIKRQAYAAKGQQEQKIEGIIHTVSATYAQYRRQALIAAAAALAVLVAVGGYSLYQAGNDRKASAMLSRAYDYYSPDKPGRRDYEKALELFRDINSNYSGTLSGAIARYYAGNCLMDMGQMQAAVTEYQNFVKRHGGEKELLGLVYQRMGYAYASLGNRDEALKSFELAESVLGPGLATLELAKAYEQAGKGDEAGRKYKMLAEGLPGTQLAEEAGKKIPQGSGASPAPAKAAK